MFVSSFFPSVYYYNLLDIFHYFNYIFNSYNQLNIFYHKNHPNKYPHIKYIFLRFTNTCHPYNFKDNYLNIYYLNNCQHILLYTSHYSDYIFNYCNLLNNFFHNYLLRFGLRCKLSIYLLYHCKIEDNLLNRGFRISHPIDYCYSHLYIFRKFNHIINPYIQRNNLYHNYCFNSHYPCNYYISLSIVHINHFYISKDKFYYNRDHNNC